ncbi:hypothetical protein JZU54_07060, partial [bacterium]|nr:hypothetical protein [bacterium]
LTRSLLRLLFLTPSLGRVLVLAPAWIGLVRREGIPWRHTNLKLNDFIPLRIAAITLGDSQEFSKPTTRIDMFSGVFYFAHLAIMAYTGRVIQLRRSISEVKFSINGIRITRKRELTH